MLQITQDYMNIKPEQYTFMELSVGENATRYKR